jgi:hypothetical protein
VKSLGELVDGDWVADRICDSETALTVVGLPELRLRDVCKGEGRLAVVVSFVDEAAGLVWLQPKEETGALLRLTHSLNVHYGRCEGEGIANALRGAVVAARFADDRCWYRAAVLRRLDATRYSVYFLDYGNSAAVSAADLRLLSARWLRTPPFALPVARANLPAHRRSTIAQHDGLFLGLQDNRRLGFVGRLLCRADGGRFVDAEEVLGGRLNPAPLEPPPAAANNAGQRNGLGQSQQQQPPQRPPPAFAQQPPQYKARGGWGISREHGKRL